MIIRTEENKHCQAKDSIIFEACWLAGYHGATMSAVLEALKEAGIETTEKRLLPRMKTFLRKGNLKRYKNKWVVEKPFSL